MSIVTQLKPQTDSFVRCSNLSLQESSYCNNRIDHFVMKIEYQLHSQPFRILMIVLQQFKKEINLLLEVEGRRRHC